MRLLVGPGAHEGGQETVVDVDHPAAVRFRHRIGNDLHEPGEHGHIHRFPLQDGLYFGKGSRLVSCREFHVVERHLKPSGKLLDVRMVGNDAHDVARQLPCPPALQDLHETVAGLGG